MMLKTNDTNELNDVVNNPSHYTSHPSGVECLEIVRHMGFNLGNVIKYIWRVELKHKNYPVEDLKKALFYLEDEIKKRDSNFILRKDFEKELQNLEGELAFAENCLADYNKLNDSTVYSSSYEEYRELCEEEDIPF